MARIACILAADFPVAAIVRANPELRGTALALSHSHEGHAELIAASASARAMGVRPGMTLAQARALAPGLTAVLPSPAAERSAHEAILDAAESFSPLVEDGGHGCAYLDLAGLAALYGAEEEMAAELARRVARVGIEAAIGIASCKETARLAAQCGGLRVIEAEKERAFLDWIPLELLDLGDDSDGLEQTLARWGIRRLGELARIDPRALGSRLGARGVELARLASGQARAPFVPRPRAELFAEAIELDYGIETLEPLSFVMRPILERIAARLALRGLVAGELTLSLGLAGREIDDRRVALAAPTIEVRSMLALIILSLEAAPPAAAVEAIRIAAEPRTPRRAQSDLFLPPAPAPERLQATIARLAAWCGPDRVGTLKPVNSHRPEAIEVAPFDPPRPDHSPAPKAEGSNGSNVTRLVIRAIRPAQEVEVMCARGGMPEFVRGQNLCARVVSISGPWRRQGEWWLAALSSSAPLQDQLQPAPFNRDYYDIALADGGVYRMYRDLRSHQWFVDGLYD